MAGFDDFTGSILDQDRERTRRNEPVFNAMARATNAGYDASPLQALLQRSGVQVPQRTGQSYFPGANVQQFTQSLDPQKATQSVPQFSTPSQPGPAIGSFGLAIAQAALNPQPQGLTPNVPLAFAQATPRQPIFGASPPIGVNDPYGFLSMSRAQSRGRNP